MNTRTYTINPANCGLTLTNYKHGCRCEPCRQAWNAYYRKQSHEQQKKPRVCANCGAEYSKATGGGNKHCSTKCRKQASNKATNTCIMCQREFTALNYRSKACPDCVEEYRDLRRRETENNYPDRECKGCGQPFTPTGSAQKYCSKSCRPTPPPAATRQCLRCGTPGVKHPRKYCSDYCATEAALAKAGKRVNDLYALACTLGIHGWGWRQKLYRLLIERDGPGCQICRRPINMTMRSGPKGHPSGKGPSIDHIHPKARGGTDDLWNLQLTHWKCNRAKRDRPTADTRQQLLTLEW